jgi:hypothetical protein
MAWGSGKRSQPAGISSAEAVLAHEVGNSAPVASRASPAGICCFACMQHPPRPMSVRSSEIGPREGVRGVSSTADSGPVAVQIRRLHRANALSRCRDNRG